jgi:hypothetical protein
MIYISLVTKNLYRGFFFVAVEREEGSRDLGCVFFCQHTIDADRAEGGKLTFEEEKRRR